MSKFSGFAAVCLDNWLTLQLVCRSCLVYNDASQRHPGQEQPRLRDLDVTKFHFRPSQNGRRHETLEIFPACNKGDHTLPIAHAELPVVENTSNWPNAPPDSIAMMLPTHQSIPTSAHHPVTHQIRLTGARQGDSSGQRWSRAWPCLPVPAHSLYSHDAISKQLATDTNRPKPSGRWVTQTCEFRYARRMRRR